MKIGNGIKWEVAVERTTWNACSFSYVLFVTGFLVINDNDLLKFRALFRKTKTKVITTANQNKD